MNSGLEEFVLRNHYGKILNEAVIENKFEGALKDFKGISRTYLFKVGPTEFIVYKTSGVVRFLVFATIYHIYIGQFDQAGIVFEGLRQDNALGYPVNYASVWERVRQLDAISPKKKLGLSQFLFKSKPDFLWAQTNNLGHHIWNEQSGLDYLLDKRSSQFNRVIAGRNDFFNYATVLREKDLKVELQSIDWENGAIWTRPLLRSSGMVLSSQTRHRLLEHMRGHKMGAVEENVIQIIKKYKTFVVIQIRQHERRWLSERNELRYLLEWILQLDPNLCIGIDGFGKINKEDDRHVARNINRENEFIQQLLLICPERIVALAGLTVLSKAVILKNADIVVGPIGSGGVLSTWVLHKPLITYGPTSYYEWTKLDSERVPEEPLPEVIYIPKELIHDVADNDYDFSWKELQDPIKKYLNKKWRAT
jgi:hypothetical protein